MKRELIIVLLEAKNPSCEVLQKLYEMNLNANIFQINAGPIKTNHLTGFMKDHKKNIKNLNDNKITFCNNTRNKTWIETNSCEVCRNVSILKMLIVNVNIYENKMIHYKLLFSSRAAIEKLKKNLDKENLVYRIINNNEKLSKELTLRQMEILLVAMHSGYFDIQRKINLDGLAQQLGITKKAVQESLKRSVNKILNKYIFEEL